MSGREGRLLRSILFVPADRADMLAKAPGLGSDGVVVDLEDAVAPHRKDAARAGLADALAGLRAAYAGELFVRVNAWETGQTPADLAAFVGSGPATVVLPKAELDGLAATRAWLDEHEGPGGPTRVLPLVESARGVQELPGIARSGRLTGLAIGLGEYGDLEASLGCGHADDESMYLYSRSRLVVAARAAGLDVLVDGVWTRHTDLDGLRGSARRARSLGFTGKWAIHPAQVPVVNDAFRPSPAEVERACGTIRAVEAAHREGRGTATYAGQLVDTANLRKARQVLDLDALATARDRDGLARSGEVTCSTT